MVKKYKVGIVGFGYMGEIRKRIIEKNNDLELTGICDTSEKVRTQIKDIPTFDSFDKLLQQNLDIIFVCTPNRFSPEICIEGLKNKKHVFCEKPPGRTVEEIKLIQQAEKPPSKLMFGFNHRFHPGIMKAKVIIDSHRLGKILSLRGVYGKSGGSNFTKSWRNNKAISGGGILLDQGIHMLDLFRYFCGDFEQIKCYMNHLFWNFDLEDNAFIILKNKAGQLASLHSSSTLWKHTFKLEIFLEEGYIILEGLLSKTGSYGQEKLIIGKRQFEHETEALGNPSEEITYFDQDQSWELEVKTFVRAIKQNEEILMSSSEDALKVMQMIATAYEDTKK